METVIYQSKDMHQEAVRKTIRSVIRQGGLIVFPTETVYGIGANAMDENALAKIFLTKGRPQDNPLIMHIGHVDELKELVIAIPETAKALIQSFWPGPLTLIFEKKPHIPLMVTGGLDTVAIRMPSHPVALEVIRLAGTPICAPSANISGRPSSTDASHVIEDFMGKVDLIIDGGKTDIGIESTVLDVISPIPTLLRPGAITKEMIESVLNMPILDATETKVVERPKSPGMKYAHYAPKGQVTLLEGSDSAMINHINHIIQTMDPKTSALIAPSEIIQHIKGDILKINLGSTKDLDLIAKNLFNALREVDRAGIQDILITSIPEQDLGQAIMNRFKKASGYHIVHL